MQGSQWLPRSIPMCWAMELLLTGENIDAETALRIGMVNRVVPREELMPTAERMARRICANGQLAVRSTKEQVVRGLSMPLMEGLRFSALNQGFARSNSPEIAERVRAIGERKK